MTEQNNNRITLAGQDAYKLYKQGRHAWNAWVAENPEANINFRGWDFSEEGEVNFGGFNFPNGRVNFREAQFGDSNVSFVEAQFGDGCVSFGKAQFGDSNVYFWNAQFETDRIDFSMINCGGQFNFILECCLPQNIDFSCAHFKQDAYIYISYASKATADSEIPANAINFKAQRMQCAGRFDFDYRTAHAISLKLDFSQACLQQLSCFRLAMSSDSNRSQIDLLQLDFNLCQFAGPMDLQMGPSVALHCIPDFIGTQNNAHLYLHEMDQRIDIKALESRYQQQEKDAQKDPKNGKQTLENLQQQRAKQRDALCRLKEIAQQNCAHLQMLHFHAYEMQWRRPLVSSKFLRLCNRLYQWTANYGLSAGRPLIWLLLWMLLMSLLLWRIDMDHELISDIREILLTGISPMQIAKLNDQVPQNWGYWRYFAKFGLEVFNWLGVMILTFLTLLGLRNRFKLK